MKLEGYKFIANMSLWVGCSILLSFIQRFRTYGASSFFIRYTWFFPLSTRDELQFVSTHFPLIAFHFPLTI